MSELRRLLAALVAGIVQVGRDLAALAREVALTLLVGVLLLGPAAIVGVFAWFEWHNAGLLVVGSAVTFVATLYVLNRSLSDED